MSLTSPTVRPCPVESAYQPIYREEGQVYCNSTWDGVTCWPTTLGGEMAVMPCPRVFNNVYFDTTTNATKMCYHNASWHNLADYDSCRPLDAEISTQEHNNAIRIIYYTGFCTSTAALIVALFIFLYYKSLRCLRNTIHCHLIVTFIAKNILWVIMDIFLHLFNKAQANKDESDTCWWVCRVMIIFYNYLQTANFFWMLVEGVYLHTMIVWTFTIEKVRFLYYAILGWGVPALIVFVWAVVRALEANEMCWLPTKNQSHYYDLIYIIPILLVLLINLIFLTSIVWVLITKLRASNTLHIRQYRKAVKATVILLPLLGITYVLFITPPSNDKTTETVFTFVNAILQSFQGLAVAFFYCFLNGEVRTTIQTRVSRWQDGRSITTRYSRASIATNEHIGLTKNLATDQSPGSQRNGQSSISSGSKEHQKNNNTNGVNHMHTPMMHLRDEAL